VTRQPFVLQGVHYELGHLAPFILACLRPASTATADTVPLRIDVAFSHHCYTVGTAQDPAAAEIYHVAERGDVRLFNTAPWELSRTHLPGMVLALPTAKVEHTWERRNYRYALSMPQSDGSEYQMFFSLRRSSDPCSDLRLFVESAYTTLPANRPKGPGIIRFVVLAMKVLRGEQIRLPPRR
jgi:hypothetical protein